MSPTNDIGNEDSANEYNSEDEFLNGLFTVDSLKQEFEYASNELVSDSFDENVSITFSISKDKLVVAEFGGKNYFVGVLDLTEEEYLRLSQITEISVELIFHRKDILINQTFQDVLHIKRIPERNQTQDPSNQHHQYVKCFAEINLVRIQFSMNEPRLAKYDNNIFIVGKHLHTEYNNLLDKSNTNCTAIRLNEKRIVIDNEKRIIDVNQVNVISLKESICVINGTTVYDDQFMKKFSRNEYSRYIINYNPYISIEKVEEMLIYSSDHDNCSEIYAEFNFPFDVPSNEGNQLNKLKETLKKSENKLVGKIEANKQKPNFDDKKEDKCATVG